MSLYKFSTTSLIVLIASCATANHQEFVKKSATFDLSCPSEKIELTEIETGKWGASGCGKKASYRVTKCSMFGNDCKTIKDSETTSK